jgi:hippurate hydrolase
MPPLDGLSKLVPDMARWRHAIHAHPETAFEEVKTSALVAETLAGLRIEVHRGLAGTGVVGTLKAGSANRAIGLRADMDALHIQETNGFDHRSTVPGKMHACGHDGHTAMLLGAAKHLAATKNFDGIVHFIFQPAEENEGGGRRMVEEGLFDKFPVEAVFGLHNLPGLALGEFAIRPGPMLSAYDIFEIVIEGRGSHAAMPHQSIDPVPIAAQLVLALQTIVSRGTDPFDAAVVSVTQIHGGDTWNVIPQSVRVGGTVRTFDHALQDRIEAEIGRMARDIPAAFGAKASLRYERRYPATVNHPAETEQAAAAAQTAVGPAGKVHRDKRPLMGSEDFAFMLQARPGAFIFLGNGAGDGGCMLHNPGYDFNDKILATGAGYWVSLVESLLPARG